MFTRCTRFRREGVLVAWIVLASLVVGCGPKTVGRSILTTTIGTRTVKASVDGPSFISSQDDVATVTFSGGKLVVEKTRVLRDDKEIAQLPAEATKVDIDYTAGTLSITADGVSVFPTKRAQ
jgi:hypothetical protein